MTSDRDQCRGSQTNQHVKDRVEQRRCTAIVEHRTAWREHAANDKEGNKECDAGVSTDEQDPSGADVPSERA
jgi:hypothetical protein